VFVLAITFSQVLALDAEVQQSNRAFTVTQLTSIDIKPLNLDVAFVSLVSNDIDPSDPLPNRSQAPGLLGHHLAVVQRLLAYEDMAQQ
jgi:hypothetical protein